MLFLFWQLACPSKNGGSCNLSIRSVFSMFVGIPRIVFRLNHDEHKSQEDIGYRLSRKSHCLLCTYSSLICLIVSSSLASSLCKHTLIFFKMYLFIFQFQMWWPHERLGALIVCKDLKRQESIEAVVLLFISQLVNQTQYRRTSFSHFSLAYGL